MGATSHRPTPERAVYPISRDSPIQQSKTGEPSQGSAAPSTRLHAIHELVRSGDYHVPAAAIADRIIERIMVDRREDES